jgi:hypothetical protein
MQDTARQPLTATEIQCALDGLMVAQDQLVCLQRALGDLGQVIHSALSMLQVEIGQRGLKPEQADAGQPAAPSAVTGVTIQ